MNIVLLGFLCSCFFLLHSCAYTQASGYCNQLAGGFVGLDMRHYRTSYTVLRIESIRAHNTHFISLIQSNGTHEEILNDVAIQFQWNNVDNELTSPSNQRGKGATVVTSDTHAANCRPTNWNHPPWTLNSSNISWWVLKVWVHRLAHISIVVVLMLYNMFNWWSYRISYFTKRRRNAEYREENIKWNGNMNIDPASYSATAILPLWALWNFYLFNTRKQ